MQLLKLLPTLHLYIQLEQLPANQQDLDEPESTQNLSSELLHACSSRLIKTLEYDNDRTYSITEG